MTKKKASKAEPKAKPAKGKAAAQPEPANEEPLEAEHIPDAEPQEEAQAGKEEAQTGEAEAKAKAKAGKEEAEPGAKRPPKFVYNCVNCGQYCSKVEGVPVTLYDLRLWHSLEMMTTIMPHLELTEDHAANPRLILAPIGGMGESDLLSGLMDDAIAKKEEGGLLNRLRRKKGRKGDDDTELDAEFEELDPSHEEEDGTEAQAGEDTVVDTDGTEIDGAGEADQEAEAEAEEADRRGCPFHDGDNNVCQIHHAMPTSCRAFPLGSNGQKYFIVDRECKGLGHGQMTVESLKSIRDAAKADFEARTETGQLLTTLYSLFMGRMAAQSAKVMGNMDPEKLKQLGDLLGHGPPPGAE